MDLQDIAALLREWANWLTELLIKKLQNPPSWDTALATLALVVVTGWVIWWQTKRTKIAQNTERFLQLRQRGLSPEHAVQEGRVIALLMHLEKQGRSTGDLEFSPDINLYLNDYQWIGRLVQDKMINKHYARATYGRNLLLLYKKLKPYIEKERALRHYKTLWTGVDYLYKKFKKLDKNKLHKLPKDKFDNVLNIERRWLHPSTILITKDGMREEIDLDRVVQDLDAQYNVQGVVSRHDFYERNGQDYQVYYLNFPGVPQDESRNNFALPQFSKTESLKFADIESKLTNLIKKVWPTYEPPTVASTVAKFDKFARFALAYCGNELVAFNVYKVGIVETNVGPAKTIYVEHAGTHTEHQGKGVTQAIRNEFYRRENPDIICGSSANQLIYHANKNIAKSRGMEIYPRQPYPYVPKVIEELAKQIVESLRITNAVLDPTRLVRTYNSTVAPSPVPHELRDLLQLDDFKHVFYILVASKLNKALLEHGK